MPDRSREQNLASAIIDRKLLRILSRLLTKGHCIGGARSELRITSRVPPLRRYTVTVSNGLARLFIDGKDISESSSTFTYAREVLADIEKQIDEAPCLISGLTGPAGPGPREFARLEATVEAIKASGLPGMPFAIHAPAHLFPEHEGEDFSSDEWATTLGTPVRTVSNIMRLSTDGALSDRSLIDHCAKAGIETLTHRDLLATPALNRMLCSMDLNQRIMGISRTNTGREALLAFAHIFSPYGREKFSSFVASLLDKLFSPKQWEEDFGDISCLTKEQQKSLLADSLFFKHSDGWKCIDTGIAIGTAPGTMVAGELMTDEFKWFVEEANKHAVFKTKLTSWELPARLMRRVFEDHVPGRRHGHRGWELSATLPDGTRVRESSPFSLYGTVMLANLISLSAFPDMMTVKEIDRASQRTLGVIEAVIRRLYEARTDTFAQKALARGVLTGRRIPRDDDAVSPAAAPEPVTLTAEERVRNIAKLARGLGNILEPFYSEVTALHNKHHDKYTGLCDRPDGPDDTDRTFHVQARGSRDTVLTVSYRYSGLRYGGTTSWMHSVFFGSPQYNPRVIFTGLTARTISANIKNELSKRDLAGNDHMDRIIADCDTLLSSVASQTGEHIRLLKQAVAEEQEKLLGILTNDFPEEYFEAYCTAPSNP